MNECEKVIQELAKMNETIRKIDMSITGDPERGSLGMKQHFETLNSAFYSHLETDKQEFERIQEYQQKIDGKISKLMGWIAGMSATVVFICPILVWFINKLFFSGQ